MISVRTNVHYQGTNKFPNEDNDVGEDTEATCIMIFIQFCIRLKRHSCSKNLVVLEIFK